MTAPEQKPRGRRRRRLVALVVGVVVALLVVEVVLRVAGVAPPAVTKIRLVRDGDRSVLWDCYPTNPHGDFEALPDTSQGRWRATKMLDPPVDVPLADLAATPWCVEVLHGALGVRGPAVRSVPAPGVLRIAGIGDSFALGEGVPFGKTLFVRLQDELGDGHQVLNCAQSGADLELDVSTLEWAVPAYRCPRALVVFVPNDVALTDALRERQGKVYDLINLREEHLHGGAERPWYVGASRLVSLLHSWRERSRITEETLAGYRDAYDEAHNAANLAALDRALRRLAAQPTCRVALVLFPLMIGLDADYPLAGVHAKVADMARAAGLPVLDLVPAFAGQDAADLHVHVADHHPNGRAHAIAAEAIAAWLRSDVDGFLRAD